MMDAGERPNKIRKINHEGSSSLLEDETTSIDQNEENGPLDSGETAVLPDLTLDSMVESRSFEETQNVEANNDPGTEGNASVPTPEQIAPLVNSAEQQEGTPLLSKTQQKKLRKKVEWESKRDERKVIRKEKQTAKRERKRAARQLQAEDANEAPSQFVMANAVQLPITILVDCDFDDLMRDNERISLAAQITRCYSDNRHSRYRAHLTLCSFGGKLRERFDNVLTHYKSWRGVRALDCDFVEAGEKASEWMQADGGGKMAGVFAKYAELDEPALAELRRAGEVVYLSSEADEDLTELKPFSTYVIGGLVDKNREKGICYKRATQRGVRTARLPIGEYMEMQSRKVLATNHVNEIMVKWLECGSWADAFMQAIPKRKGGTLRTEQSSHDHQDAQP